MLELKPTNWVTSTSTAWGERFIPQFILMPLAKTLLQHIFESIKGSLERLQMDYVDVLQCHGFDDRTPIAETVPVQLSCQLLLHSAEFFRCKRFMMSSIKASRVISACRTAAPGNVRPNAALGKLVALICFYHLRQFTPCKVSVTSTSLSGCPH